MKNKILYIGMQKKWTEKTVELLNELFKYFEVIVIALDTPQNQIAFKNADFSVHYSSIKNKYLKYMKILSVVKHVDKMEAPDLIVSRQFLTNLLIPLIVKRNKTILRFAHFSVQKNPIKNLMYTTKDVLCIFIFKHVVYAMQVMPNWILKSKKYIHKTNEWSRDLSSKPKVFNKIRLLYIGSLSQRRVDETLIGLRMYIDEAIDKVDIRYDIIGTGDKETVDNIIKTIDELGLTSIVSYHGRLSDDEIKPYFDNCNVGVAYVPITKYYTNNTPSKTVEYLIAGMAVIATRTKANQRYVHEKNGVLINDTPKSFCEGLMKLNHSKENFISQEIRNEYKDLAQTNLIIKNQVDTYNNIINNNR